MGAIPEAFTTPGLPASTPSASPQRQNPLPDTVMRESKPATIVDHEPPWRLASLAFAFRASRALMAAIDAGLFTELARGPRTAAQLCRRLELPASRRTDIADLADALVGLGLLTREGRGDGALYLDSREAERFLDHRQAGYLGDQLRASLRAEGEDWSAWTLGLGLHHGGNAIGPARRAGHDDGPAGGPPSTERRPTPCDLFEAALPAAPIWTTHRAVLHLSADEGRVMRGIATRHPGLATTTRPPPWRRGPGADVDLLVIDLPWPLRRPSLGSLMRQAAKELPGDGAVLLLEHEGDSVGPGLAALPREDDTPRLLESLSRRAHAGAAGEAPTPDRSTRATEATAPLDVGAVSARPPVMPGADLRLICQRAGWPPPILLLSLGGHAAWYTSRRASG